MGGFSGSVGVAPVAQWDSWLSGIVGSVAGRFIQWLRGLVGEATLRNMAGHVEGVNCATCNIFLLPLHWTL